MEWALLALNVGLFLYNKYLVDGPNVPRPMGQQFTIAISDEGVAVPMVYGTFRVDNSIIVWCGNQKTVPPAGQASFTFSYGVDMIFVIGIPAYNATAKLRRLWWGDKIALGFDGSTMLADGGQSVLLVNLGDGVDCVGFIQFHGGSSSQNVGASTTLAYGVINTHGDDVTLIPGYRNQIVATIACSTNGGISIGASPQVPTIGFEIVSIPGIAILGPVPEANPASVIQDILTSAVWKIGLSGSDIDSTSFATAVSTLFAENHGFSAALSGTADATSILTGILSQVNGVLYQSAATGLIKIRLFRSADTAYSVAVTPDDVIGKPEYTTTTWADTYNQVRIRYYERNNNYQQAQVVAQNLALISMQGGRIRTLELQYPGVCTAALASKLAARDLAAASRPRVKITCTLSRSFYAIEPGDVLTVNLSKYGVSSKRMRVLTVDLGQLADRGVRVTLVDDVFDSAGQYGTMVPSGLSTRVDPLTQRLLIEAPRYQVAQLANVGIAADPDAPVVLSCATPDDGADKYEQQTYYPKTVVQSVTALNQTFTTDIPGRTFPVTFTLVNNYPRINEPYDTTSNQLVVTNLKNWTLSVGFENLGATDGTLQFALVTPSGQVEIVSCETITNLGGSPTQYRLNNVWRGLIDTVPLDHTSGERGYIIGVSCIGRLSYNVGNTIKAKAIPWHQSNHGSGEDPVDLLTMTGRALRPYPAANQGVGGDNVTGTLGIPTSANRNKILSVFEEGLDLYGTMRERRSAAVIRGDATDDTLVDTTLYTPVAVFKGTAIPHGNGASGTIQVLHQLNGTLAVTVAGVLGGACWCLDGYGSIDVAIQAFGALPTAGKYGIAANGSNFDRIEQNTVRTNVFAAAWRNLLTNVRWNYQTGGVGPTASPPAWDNFLSNTGTAVIGSGTFSLSRLASGNGSNYLGTSSTAFTRGQRIPLGYRASQSTGDGNWLPRGLTAIACGYFRNANSDTNDTFTLTVLAYGYPGAFLASNTSGAVVPATANWTYREITMSPSTGGALPSGTANAGVQIDFAEVAAGGGSSAADSCATEMALYVGQFASNTSSLLANYSFDSGATTNWTVDSGGFVVVNTIASPSIDYAQGGAFASSQIHQDYALPTGYEYGTAILRCFRAQTLANDAGTVTIQVLDGSNTVLASSTTGSEQMASLNIWYGRTLYVDTPDNAAKIRVIFIATRSLGAGNSGACFDEAKLMVAKHLDASSSTVLTFDTPTVQPMPTTWQEYHLAYPSNPVPDTVFTGEAPYSDTSTEWSDGTVRANSLLYGQYGGGLTSVDAYAFTRIASPSQIYVQPAGAAVQGAGSTIGAYTINGSFTVLFYYRVDEPGFSSICGILGRMNATRGWGVNITAAGQLQAMLRGAGSTQKTVATGRTATEGGFHMGCISYDSSAHLLYVYDEIGGVSVSTASGLGDFASLSSDTDVFMRIGTDAPDHDSLPGMVGPVYLWSVALTAGQIASHWNYAKDPTGAITTYTRTNTAIVPMAPDGNGDTACIMTASQFAQPYKSTLTLDGGTGYGAAFGTSATNLLLDTNFAGANWVKDASATLTQSIPDPTGRPRGIQVAGNGSNGIYGQNIPLAASPTTVPIVFWSKSISGSTTLAVELRTSTGTLESTQNVTLTTLWQKFTLTLTGWAGGAANCRIRFVPSATATFQLAGIMCVTQGTDIPAILPLPGTTHGAYNATISTARPQQFIWEGEIIAQGTSMIDSPTANGMLVSVFGSTNANRRDLTIQSGGTGFQAVHYDDAGSPASVTATSAYTTYSSRIWKARSRWALSGMLDNVSPQDFSAVAWTDDTHATPTVVTGRTAAWTIGVTSLATVKIAANGTAPSDVILRSVVLRAREEKLP
jgi:hypothetical protein